MKRFMLVSLMSCMLVGQTSCDWRENTKEFFKGAVNSMARSAGAFCLLGLLFGEKAAVGAAGLSVCCSTWRGCGHLEDATAENSQVPVKRGWRAGGLIAGSAATCAIIWGLGKKGIIDLSVPK